MTVAEIYNRLSKIIEGYDEGSIDATQLRDGAMDAVLAMGKIIVGEV